MTVLNMAARGFQVLVGDLDVTSICSGEEFWFRWRDDKVGTDGRIKTSGELVLHRDLTFSESLDPRVNRARWAIGVSVTIRVLDSNAVLTLHHRSGLRIASVPNVPTTNDKFLRLQLVDRLSQISYRQPPNERSGVVLGTARSRTAIINSLLIATGEPGVVLSDAVPDYTINYPLPKFDSGSFVEQASKVAYSGLKVLWVDNAQLVRAADFSLAPALLAARTVYQLKEYEPLQGTELPVETVRCVGTTQRVELTPSRVDFPVNEIYGPASVIAPTLVGTTVLGRTTGYETWNGTIRTVVTETWKVLGAILPEYYPASTTLWKTDITIETWVYETGDRGRLVSKKVATSTILGDALRDWIAANSDGDTPATPGGEITYTLLSPVDAKLVTTTFTYGQPTTLYSSVGSEDFSFVDDTIAAVKVVTRELVGVLAPDTGLATPQNLTDSEIVVTKYSRGLKPDEWKKSVVTQKALIRAYPEAAEDKSLAERLSLIVVGAAAPATDSGGESTPPQIEYRPDTHTQVQVPLKGEWQIVPYPGGQYQDKMVPEQVEYAVSNGQLRAIARVRSGLRVGSHQGRTIECPLDDYWLYDYAPLKRFDVTEEDGTEQIYLVDGHSGLMSAREWRCAFDAIWLGTRKTYPLSGGGSVTLVEPPYQDVIISETATGVYGKGLTPLPYALTSTATLSDSSSGGNGGDRNYSRSSSGVYGRVELPQFISISSSGINGSDANYGRGSTGVYGSGENEVNLVSQEFEERYSSGKDTIYVPRGFWSWREDTDPIPGVVSDPDTLLDENVLRFTQCNGSLITLTALYYGTLHPLGTPVVTGTC